eukprot:1011825_1
MDTQMLLLLYLFSTINGLPKTCSDISHVGPAMVQNCRKYANSPILNGDCCTCSPKKKAPYECINEGCSRIICPTQIPLNEDISKISATTNVFLNTDLHSIDSDSNIDDDFMDIAIELNDGASSDNAINIDDDLDENTGSKESYENESQDENSLNDEHVYNGNGDDDGAEKRASVTFSESKTFNGILYGTIGVV